MKPKKSNTDKIYYCNCLHPSPSGKDRGCYVKYNDSLGTMEILKDLDGLNIENDLTRLCRHNKTRRIEFYEMTPEKWLERY